MGSCNAESLAEAAGATAQQRQCSRPLNWQSAIPRHGLNAGHRLERADQNRFSPAYRVRDRVETPMDSVAAVTVRMTGPIEHNRISRGATAVRMIRFVSRAVRFGLHDDSGEGLTV